MNIDSETQMLREVVSNALKKAKQLGATDAEVAITKTEGINIGTRMREVETIEFNRDGALGITVYRGKRKGSASTADFSEQALQMTIQKAIEIAKFTSEDDCSGLGDKQLMEFNPPDLDLYHPDERSTEDMIELALLCETAALVQDKRISNSDGASYSSYQGVRVYGNSYGLLNAYPSTRHSLSCGVIAGEGEQMQRDYDYCVARDANLLKSAEAVGKRAAENAVSRLNSEKISTRKAPILFHREVANSLFGHFVAAISGGNIYRRSSFLLDAVGKQVFPEGLNIIEKPHLKKQLASSPFDSEGIQTKDMKIVSDGMLELYLTTSYSGRKLGLQSNGHAGGIHNWLIDFGSKNFEQLLKEMGTGFLVTELMGQGVNMVTGDYSRGAAGFWIENGEVIHPVEEVTVAGNLQEMFGNIIEVGSDTDQRGSIQTGSVLISEMQIAGS